MKIIRQPQSKETVGIVLSMYKTGDWKQKEIAREINRSFERVRMIIHQELEPEQIEFLKKVVSYKRKIKQYQIKLDKLCQRFKDQPGSFVPTAKSTQSSSAMKKSMESPTAIQI
jgi:hypothetical protein